MFSYFSKRLLIFIPTLIVISWVAFFLSKMAPGDPVDEQLKNEMIDASSPGYEKIYSEKAKEMGLDRPTFYCSFTSKAYPDTLYKIVKYTKRSTLKKLIAQYGNWEQIDQYYQQINQLDRLVKSTADKKFGNKLINYRRDLQQLFVQDKDERITIYMDKLKNTLALTEISTAADSNFYLIFYAPTKDLIQKYQTIKEEAAPSKLYTPALRWHGFDNQYHNWAVNFIRGDFGLSNNGQTVMERLSTPIFWTVLMSVISLLIAFLLAIPLGVYSAVKRNSLFDRISTLIVFMFFSLPSFWIATMLVVFFTTAEYGEWMDIFPSIGLGNLSSDAPFWDRFWEKAGHLILPILCLVYPSLAFISRQTRGGMINVVQQDYIRTARAKGLEERMVIWKHGFRNALFPLISLFAIVFPSILVGSVIIEVIFSIPGMGRITIESIQAEDWPIVFTVLMLVSILTLIGNFIADILYALADPRVSFK